MRSTGGRTTRGERKIGSWPCWAEEKGECLLMQAVKLLWPDFEVTQDNEWCAIFRNAAEEASISWTVGLHDYNDANDVHDDF